MNSANLIDISTLEQLNAIRYDMNGEGIVDISSNAADYEDAFGGTSPTCPSSCKGYELVNDLDFENVNGSLSRWAEDAVSSGIAGAVTGGWVPIGNFSSRFNATFNGGGYTISNLYIDRSDRYIGLFGFASKNIVAGRPQVVIRNLGLENVNITGSGSESSDIYVAGLAGLCRSYVVSVYVTGTITGTGSTSLVGGIAGLHAGSIMACYTRVDVTGPYYVGGLVGKSDGDVDACYTMGTASGSSAGSEVGALLGFSYRSSSSSYTVSEGIGLFGSIQVGVGSCYFDIDVAGIPPETLGRSTSALQTPTSYTGIYLAWDDKDLDSVLDEDIDNATVTGDLGADAIWDFGTSDQYPVLSIDFNRDGVATASEFGDQGRGRFPEFKDSAGGSLVSAYTFTISENSAADTEVNGTPRVFSENFVQTPITYTLLNESDDEAYSGPFKITEAGAHQEIQVKSGAQLDFESGTTSYAFRVRASDNSSPPGTRTVNVSVRITDVNEAPVFTASSYSFTIAEDVASVTALSGSVPIEATDPEGGVVGYFLSNSTDGFLIDTDGGILFVSPPFRFNFEDTPTYNFAIHAEVTSELGGSISEEVSVIVTVTDVDEAPEFVFADGESSLSFTVLEDASAGTSLSGSVPIEATDPEGGSVSYSLLNGDGSTYTGALFNILSGESVIRVSSGAVLDFETMPTYALQVQATAAGSGVVAAVPVTITITGMDEPPEFTSSSYSFTLAEGASAATVLSGSVPISAVDPEGGSVSYSFVNTSGSPMTSPHFAIDSSSGVIRVKAGAFLNFEDVSSFSLRVQASDSSASSSTADVSISLTDVNEAPVFTASSYSFTIAEDVTFIHTCQWRSTHTCHGSGR